MKMAKNLIVNYCIKSLGIEHRKLMIVNSWGATEIKQSYALLTKYALNKNSKLEITLFLLNPSAY